MKLVIVESPSKAKTINKYLGKDFQVMASFGHVRDLSVKSDSVRPADGFAMDWEVQKRGEKTLRDIIRTLEKADSLYLASDPDREGEAIAWHVVQELKRRKKLKKDFPVYRVVFHEITKNAILNAIKEPRQIDMQLVDAYLARRALDYLVGFSISPLLWRKLPGAKSAGRVQSVALRLVCEREDEIASFKSQEYWTIEADLKTTADEKFKARLTHVDGKKLDKFDLNTQSVADILKKRIENTYFSVGKIEKKQAKRNPAPAFTTSTLQQEASRKLGFSAKKTMQTAQSLYEGVSINGENIGLITYMRTDSVALSNEAVTQIRELIEKEYGTSYVPEKPRFYKNTSKNAQEAHEAIRPTSVKRLPSEMTPYLNTDQRKLYELIWKRTVACQMASALMDKVSVDMPSKEKDLILHATGQTIAFAGFIKVYKEDIDDKSDDDESKLLPQMQENDALTTIQVLSEQHFTEPPPRFSEASLVKKLEELGIGRPSTYASILSVLQDRNYVKLINKRFIPEDTGRIVTAFLENYFTKYIQYDYTAQLENKLDDITNGATNSNEVLTDFWNPFDQNLKQVDPVKMGEVLETVSKSMEKHLFPTEESRICPDCNNGKLSLKVGRFGAFIGCSNYPKCKHTKQVASLMPTEPETDIQESQTTEVMTHYDLGKDELGRDIIVKKGPYGWYVQAGENTSAKRTGLPKGKNPESLTIQEAIGLLSLPRTLGTDPKTKEIIEAGLGKFGPFVKRGKVFRSLEPTDDVMQITLERAIELLAQENAKSKIETIGQWNDQEITYQIGRYGPYVKCGKIMASVKKRGQIPSLEEAITLLQEKMHQK